MCYEPSHRPPAPPIAGGSATGEHLTLRSDDGTEFAAFAAAAGQPNGAGMVVLPDVRGLHAFYEDLALRFGEQGIHAVAIDYFGRTAGVGRRDDEFDFWPHVAETHPKTLNADIAAAVEHVRSMGAERVFTVGFCFGGRNSFNQAATDLGLAGVIGFYGRLAAFGEGDTNTCLALAPSYRVPVLGLFGGDDPFIPPEDVDAFREALASSGAEHDIVVYPGAPHSFFDRAAEQFSSESDDAWRRILAFVDAHRG